MATSYQTQIVANQIQNATGSLLASGTLYAQYVDATGKPVNAIAGGGGQITTTPASTAITNGSVGSTFFVYDVSQTVPAGLFIHLWAVDSSTGQIVMDYPFTQPTGAIFILDNYTYTGQNLNVPTGQSVAGPLVVNGNLTVTGTLVSGFSNSGAAAVLGTFSLAATTWTVTHNLGTQAIAVYCYDSNWNEIIPKNIQNNSVNQTTVTFTQPQTGYAVCFNVGNWTPSVTSPNNIIGNPTSSQSISGNFPFNINGGTLNASRIGAIRYASMFNGADCGAKINAAFADLGSNSGEVWFDNACGTAWTTAVTIPNNQTLRDIQGGTYTTTQTITLNENSAFIGVAPAGQGFASGQHMTRVQAAASANLTHVVTFTSDHAVLQNILFDGNKATGGTNNTNSSVIYVNNANRVIMDSVSAVNGAWDNLQIFSTGTTNNSCCGRIYQSFFASAANNNLTCTGSADWIVQNTEFENAGNDGINGSGCSTMRINNFDMGGNQGNGITIAGLSTAGGGGNGWIITGGQFGNNKKNDIKIDNSTSGGAYWSYGHTIAGCSFIGGTLYRPDATYAAISAASSADNQITGNFVASGSPSRFTYAYEETGSPLSGSAVTGNVLNGGGFSSSGDHFSLLASASSLANNLAIDVGSARLHNHYLSNGDTGLLLQDASGTFGKLVAQGDNNLVLYSTDASGNPRGVFSVFMRSSTANLFTNIPVNIGGGLSFNGAQNFQLPVTTFASLGTPANGSVFYCSDCTIANPCAGSGTGAVAKRVNSTWICN